MPENCADAAAFATGRSALLIDADIRDLDLEAIAFKVCCDEGWSLSRVDRVEREYRAFLQCFRDHGASGDVAPTREVDTFWHFHILDTQKYRDDCDALFDTFMHHYPYSGVFSAADEEAQIRRVARTTDLIDRLLNHDKDPAK